jgi:RNA polymerase sigma-70 factor (ECF subfamily)
VTRRIVDPALQAFLEVDYARVVAALALMCSSRPIAEDAVAEAFARAWERNERGHSIDSPGAWITRVATNLVRSGHRRRSAEARALRRLERLDGRRDYSSELSDRTVDVIAAVQRLPMRQREALVLHYWLEMSVKEIAEVLGVSDGTVKTALYRGRMAVEPLLSGHEGATQ